jgi:hypothetical protein
MIPLADKFRLGGFDYRLVRRIGDVALFEKSKPHHSRPCYDLVIVQRRKAHTWPNGKTTPAREAMPRWEQWGDAGWSYSDLARAEERFNALVASHKDSPPTPKTGSESPIPSA